MFSKIYGVFNENVDYIWDLKLYIDIVIVLWKVFDLIKFYVG